MGAGKVKKCMAGAILTGVLLRTAAAAGVGDTVESWVKKLNSDGSLITATLSLELGGTKQPESTQPARHDEDTGIPEGSAAPAETEYITTMHVQVTEPPEPEPDGDGGEPEPVSATITSSAAIRNDTSMEIDVAALAAEGLSMTLEKDSPQVLIVHTHSSEAYTQDDTDRYEESDVSRTEDKNYNVVRVGDELTERLEEYGINVIHDREIYDYPSYTGSYTRSGEAVERYLSEYPTISIVIDLHRDAIGSGDTVYKTKAEVPGQSCAQVMLLIGTGENGLYHPYWRENLKLALYMQNAMDKKYPTLARPIALKKERYNQHLTTGSMILEVGSSGNTLSEALLAIDLFASSVGPALAELIE